MIVPLFESIEMFVLSSMLSCRRLSSTILQSKVMDVSQRYCLPSLTNIKLSKREFVKVSGVDAGKLLQNACTTSIYSLLNNDSSLVSNDHYNGQYTCFLTAQGKTMFDGFIYKLPLEYDSDGVGANPFLIEVGEDIGLRLVIHLNMYRLRSKVKVEEVKKMFQVHLNGDAMGAIATVKDTRSTWNLIRCIKRIEDTKGEFEDDLENSEMHAQDSHDAHYYRMRQAYGVPEGKYEVLIRQMTPFDCNIDAMQGIDVDKGCYLGQELISRTIHKGVIRKRMMPFRMYGHLNNYMQHAELERAREGWKYGAFEKSPYADQWIDPYLLPVEDHDHEMRPVVDREYGRTIVIDQEMNGGWALVRLEEFERTPFFAIKRSDALILAEASLPPYLVINNRE